MNLTKISRKTIQNTSQHIATLLFFNVLFLYCVIPLIYRCIRINATLATLFLVKKALLIFFFKTLYNNIRGGHFS